MAKELLISVVSGIIVAIILGLFRPRDRQAPAARRPMAPPPPQWQQPRRRGSFIGGVLRFVFSVAGGMGLAFVAANALHLRQHHRFDYNDGIASHSPLLLFTVIGTVVIWLLLSAMTRR